MDDNDTKRIKEKLDFFYQEKIKVHIEKCDKEFLNGILIKKSSDNIYEIKEDKFGLMHVFISDIYDVNEFREARK